MAVSPREGIALVQQLTRHVFFSRKYESTGSTYLGSLLPHCAFAPLNESQNRYGAHGDPSRPTSALLNRNGKARLNPSSVPTDPSSSADTLLNVGSTYQRGSPLSGIRILDVGCGGGLLSEPLGRLGASVTGIDPLEENIRTADQHKSFDPVLAKRIQYKSGSLEEIVEESVETFDVIVASEVVEHVADLEMFIKCCSQVLKPGGSLFITTINKTQLSYILGIVIAEKILGIVPEGTHEWEKFVPPEELQHLLEANGFSVKAVNGMLYNPLTGSWSWMESTSVNYALHAVRAEDQAQTSQTEPLSEMESEQCSATAGTS
ncbi:ubiquinone biosynthesis O-methyltransferase, mitochondrial [Cyrtonyx montezumae]|uniref:ubiquinone biosynthesis O-methyltransferase, mitochondrial n=1 Tax=Cyrtonyx montezumae TaxID=9017 RepID=UPI0032D9F6C7